MQGEGQRDHKPGNSREQQAQAHVLYAGLGALFVLPGVQEIHDQGEQAQGPEHERLGL